jgi:hypothetical protein
MALPKYLEAFRRAARDAETREKSEVSEKRGGGGGLNSLNTLISHSEAPQNPAESDAPACAVCGAAGDLWSFDEVLVHRECARFLPKPGLAEPSAAYQAVSAEPDGTACKVEIVELAAGGRYRKVFAHLQLRPPALIDVGRWRQCVEDAKGFLAKWGEQAEQLGWSSIDLFGLHPPPTKPHPSYRRLSRYDATGLVWLLEGRSVVALTADTASIRNPDTGAVTVYRRHHKPALGPLGDSLEDFK